MRLYAYLTKRYAIGLHAIPKLATSLASVNIDRYKPKTEECTEPDGGGLYLQVFPSGAKSWQVQYKTQEGKGRRITVGNLLSHVVA